MPRTGEMIPSKFLKESDIGKGLLLTISGVEKIEFQTDEEGPQEKWAMKFHETPKFFSLNKTNIKRLEKIFGSDNTDDWTGKQIVIYFDDTVEYMGKITGGFRVRAPKTKEDDLPF